MLTNTDYDGPYTIVFRDDLLTDDFVKETEEFIGEIYRQTKEDKEKLSKDLYDLANVMKQLLFLQTEEVESYLDYVSINLSYNREKFTNPETGALNNLEDLKEPFEEFMDLQLTGFEGYNDDENIILSNIEVSSYYDLLELSSIYTEEDHSFNKVANPGAHMMYIVEFSYLVESGLEEIITTELHYYLGDDLKIADFVLAPAIFHTVSFNIPDISREIMGMEGLAVSIDPPEDIYFFSCAACHAIDLTGSAGPGLTDVGSKYTEEEIKEIILNGVGSMPGSIIYDDEAEVVAKWLFENYK